MAARSIKAFLPRPCDACAVGPAVLFCRPHSAFFCAACDCASGAGGDRHQRVWMCEVCEQAPAAVTCKADAAALCDTCDRDVHSANPLAHRHQRLPVVPFVEPINAARASAAVAVNSAFVDQDVGKINEEDVEAWLMSNPSSSVLMADFVCSDADLLGFGFGSRSDVEKVAINRSFESFESNRGFPFGDSVVPSQSKSNLSFSDEDLMNRRFESSCFDIDFSQPAKHHHNITTSNDYEQLLISSSFNYSTQHSASSSETGVVPDSEASYTFANSSASGGSGEVADGGSSAANGAPAREMDRKARVMRYREKRKNRKFQKTIRYASRKAYAETRPRIKGRFAKRTELNETGEIDQLLYGFGSGSGGFFLDHVGYGVVPSF